MSSSLPEPDAADRVEDTNVSQTTRRTKHLTKAVSSPTMEGMEYPITQDTSFDWNVNDPQQLRDRASALEAFEVRHTVQKFTGENWIDIEEQTAFFFERRYRAKAREDEPSSRNLTSRFAVGEGVLLDVGNEVSHFAFVRAIIFSKSKVRYSLWLPSMETTLHNVDSTFVSPDPHPKFKDFGEDNYS